MNFFRGPVLAAIEVWLTQRLIRSKIFNDGVRAIHRKLNEPPQPKTNIDKVEAGKVQSFFAFFKEELIAQFRGDPAPPKKDLVSKRLLTSAKKK